MTPEQLDYLKKWGRSYTEIDNWPRIIQLAFILSDENFNIITEYCELIKPDGWENPNEKSWTDNGYSTAVNKQIQSELKKFFYKGEKGRFRIGAHGLLID